MAVNIYELFGVPPSGFRPKPFVTSWLLPTYLLASIRLFLSIYCFTAIAFSFKWFADHTVIFHLGDIDTKSITFPVGAEGIRQSFSYFTYETFWGLAFYFFFASMHGFMYGRKGYTWLDNWPRSFQLMHTIYYTTITCYPLLVTTVYWGSMWTRHWWSDDFSRWNMITMHAGNSVFALFEIIFADTNPFPLAHLPILLLFMSMYLGVAYITKATEGIYIYLWLDPHNGIAKLLLHIVGYAGLLTGFFFAVHFAISLRCRLLESRRRRKDRDQPSALVSWVISKNAGSERLSSQGRPSTYWTYDEYEVEMLREERHRQLWHSYAEQPKMPEPTWDRSKGCRSFQSQATTVVPSTPRSIWREEMHKKRMSEDPGWPLPQSVPQTPVPQTPRLPQSVQHTPRGTPRGTPSAQARDSGVDLWI